MLVIRLRRVGKKNKPTYRVVVAEHSYPVDGKFTADLGFYNPHTKKVGINLDEAKTWMDKGAKPSNTIAKILQREKVKHNAIVVHERNRKPKSEKTEKPAPTAAAAPEPASDTTAEESTPENSPAPEVAPAETAPEPTTEEPA